MDLNTSSAIGRQVTKMTIKVKAALEEKATGPSKKRKPDETGVNATTQSKKAKTHPTAGNAPTSGQLRTGSVASLMESQASKQTTPESTVATSWATSCHAVVCTEEEEDALYGADVEVESDPKGLDAECESEDKAATALKDQLSMFKIQ